MQHGLVQRGRVVTGVKGLLSMFKHITIRKLNVPEPLKEPTVFKQNVGGTLGAAGTTNGE